MGYIAPNYLELCRSYNAPLNSTLPGSLHACRHRSCAKLLPTNALNFLRTTIRLISFTCFKCLRFRGQELQPYMSSLRSYRFPDSDNNHYPFRTLGNDFFESFEVEEKQNTEKRYVCLFTWLVSRAVHFEVADSLSEDSCMSAIRRFVARRGIPEIIRTVTMQQFSSEQRRKFVVNFLHSMKRL